MITESIIGLTMVVGTYTSNGSIGMYSFSFNQENATHKEIHKVKVDNPSYLTFAQNGKRIYCVSENTGENAIISAFNNDKGYMSFINAQPAGDNGACYISSNDKAVFVANYDNGSVSVFPIGENGEITESCYFESFEDTSIVPNRQASSHLHCIMPTPDNKFVLAVNLGGDCIYCYKIESQDNEIKMAKHSKTIVKEGSGPRHLVFSQNGKFAYLITELSGEVIVFRYLNGELQQLQSVNIDPNNAKGSGDIQISPDGKYLYASNRLKGDGIAILEISESGLLRKIGYQTTGIHPRNFAITPNGKFLLVACRDDNRIEIYLRNAQTGLLEFTGNTIPISKPVCVKFYQ